jgi:hypothetical protein
MPLDHWTTCTIWKGTSTHTHTHTNTHTHTHTNTHYRVLGEVLQPSADDKRMEVVNGSSPDGGSRGALQFAGLLTGSSRIRLEESAETPKQATSSTLPAVETGRSRLAEIVVLTWVTPRSGPLGRRDTAPKKRFGGGEEWRVTVTFRAGKGVAMRGQASTPTWNNGHSEEVHCRRWGRTDIGSGPVDVLGKRVEMLRRYLSWGRRKAALKVFFLYHARFCGVV